MLGRLPTAKEIQFQRRAERLREKQEAFERRFKARDLIFRKGGGRMKNLNHKETLFVQSVKKESYRAYLMEFNGTVRPRYAVGKNWSRIRRRAYRGYNTSPLKFNQWMRRWIGSQKVRYYRHDIPKMMQDKFKNLVMSNG